MMRNIGFRKVLVFGIIVLFIGMSIVSSKAFNIQKETLLDEETTGEYTLEITVLVEGIDPLPPLIFFHKVVVTHEDNSSFRIVKYGYMPFISIKIPEIYKYPDVNVYSCGYEQIRTYYYNYRNLVIYIKDTGWPRTLNNPFINRLPILYQLLKLEVR